MAVSLVFLLAASVLSVMWVQLGLRILDLANFFLKETLYCLPPSCHTNVKSETLNEIISREPPNSAVELGVEEGLAGTIHGPGAHIDKIYDSRLCASN